MRASERIKEIHKHTHMHTHLASNKKVSGKSETLQLCAVAYGGKYCSSFQNFLDLLFPTLSAKTVVVVK